jgi:hypothetical protein
MSQEMPSAEELRNVALFLEEMIANPGMTPDTAPPLKIGGLQDFPREDPLERTFGQGIAFDQEDARQAGTRLLEMAATIDAGGEVSPAEIARYQIYIDAYRAQP